MDPVYDGWLAQGFGGESNPYNQSLAMPGQPSVFASHVWMPGYIYWSLPIPARQELPIYNNAFLQGVYAPPVPHSTSVSGYRGNAPRANNQSDLSLVGLKAPRF